jgi:hypothetical protein
MKLGNPPLNNNMIKRNTFQLVGVCLLTTLLTACTTQQIADTMKILTEDTALSSGEVDAGLREALIKGISVGSDQVSQVNGYLNNPQIKIPFPPEMVKVENTLRDLGMGNFIDNFVTTLNHGAEEAAKEAKPIFVNAIKQMTIQDAFEILKGQEDAATQYLKRTTTADLSAKFMPVIQSALNKTEATKYYNDIVTTYNAIPFVQKVNPNLDEYANQLAIDGLFTMIAKEEKSIRKDPAARTTELLKKVFGSPEAGN